MKTIREMLESFYGNGSVEQQKLNQKLAVEMTAWAKISPVLALLDKHLKRFTAKKVHPDAVVEFFSAIGVHTQTELQAFGVAAADLNLENFHIYLFPTLPLEWFATTVSWHEIRQAIIDQVSGFDINNCGGLTDGEYKLVPKGRIPEILKRCISDKFLYTIETRDCDDFSRILRGWLSEINLGNLAIGAVKANIYQNNIFKYGHSFIITITEELDIYFCDAQDDTIFWKAGETPTLPLCDRIDVKIIEL